MTEIRGKCPSHSADTGDIFNSKRKSKIFGVATNDANYVTQNDHFKCKYYEVWMGVLIRSLSDNWKAKHPSYKGVRVCEEWLTFSNFRGWMEQQDWEGKQLDKDLLGDGTLYSPDTCCFISKQLNSFLISYSSRKGSGLPVGVYKSKKRYQALCRNPFGEKAYVGNFACPTKAHFEYLKKKQRYAMRFYEQESCPRIKEAIKRRFSVW